MKALNKINPHACKVSRNVALFYIQQAMIARDGKDYVRAETFMRQALASINRMKASPMRKSFVSQWFKAFNSMRAI